VAPLAEGITFEIIRYVSLGSSIAPFTNFTTMTTLNDGDSFSVGSNAFTINYAHVIGSDAFVTITSIAAVPEASAFFYGGLIAAGICGWKWRRSRLRDGVRV
jgi:hypothetical protein